MPARSVALLALMMLPGAAAVQAGAGRAPVTAPEPENPPPAHTGGFGEPTCQACHFESELNAGPGHVELAGFPDAARPDTVYRVTVRLTHPGMLRAGFMLSTRTRQGAQAGTLRATDERTATTAAGGVVYIHHAPAGTRVHGETQEWTFEWSTDGLTADDGVVVNIAANAGNDDASPFGDFIYALERVIRTGGA